MFKKYISLVMVVSRFIGMNANDVLGGLDSFGQNPYETMMQQMKVEVENKLRPVVAKLFDLGHLMAVLSDEDKKLLATVVLGEKQLETLFKNPGFKKQEAIFIKLSKEFETKGMTEENSIAFAKRAEAECPLAFKYAAIMMELAPVNDALNTLLKEILFKSLEKMDLEAIVAQ